MEKIQLISFLPGNCAYYVSICFCRNKITDIVDIYHPSLSIPQLWVVSLESSHRICSMKIGAVKKLTKFTGKHLYQSLLYLAFDSIMHISLTATKCLVYFIKSLFTFLFHVCFTVQQAWKENSVELGLLHFCD